MKTWQCVQNCGACCQLDPSDRPDLETYLSDADLALYFSLVGEDGWCIHFDAATRQCQIYDSRPNFCRVGVDTFEAMYGVSADEFNDFAIDCCHEQITGVYGGRSPERKRFNQAINNEL